MTAWKFREQKAAARLQAITGKWPKSWPPVTATGRVGHLGPQQANIDIDVLTALVGGESKSSTRKAKNPGYRLNKEDINKLVRGVKKLEEEFGVNLIPALIVSIATADTTLVATSEQWFFRLLVVFQDLVEEWDQDGLTMESLLKSLDDRIAHRLATASERYQ